MALNSLVLWAALALFRLIRLPGPDAESGWVLADPLLTFTGGSILSLAAFGISLALVQVFVRPILSAIFGMLVIRTYGPLLRLVNAGGSRPAPLLGHDHEVGDH